jgi:polyisoprenoid-binding protein YceI
METGFSKVVTSTMILMALAVMFTACRTTYSTVPTEGERTAPGSIEFVGRNMLATAQGTFHRWSFRRVDVDPQHPERSVVKLEIDIASIDTGIERRDDHLRSADFFDVDRFPTATIMVDSVTADGESESGHPRYRASFHVRIRDVEKTIEGHFEMVDLSPPRVEGDLVLNRVDFGVGVPYRWWSPTSIQNDVPVHFSTPLQ